MTKKINSFALVVLAAFLFGWTEEAIVESSMSSNGIATIDQIPLSSKVNIDLSELESQGFPVEISNNSSQGSLQLKTSNAGNIFLLPDSPLLIDIKMGCISNKADSMVEKIKALMPANSKRNRVLGFRLNKHTSLKELSQMAIDDPCVTHLEVDQVMKVNAFK